MFDVYVPVDRLPKRRCEQGKAEISHMFRPAWLNPDFVPFTTSINAVSSRDEMFTTEFVHITSASQIWHTLGLWSSLRLRLQFLLSRLKACFFALHAFTASSS